MPYLTHQSLVSVHRDSPSVVGRYRRETVIPQMVRLQHRLPVYQPHRVVPYIQHPALPVIIQLVSVYCGRIANLYLYMAKCGEIIPHGVQQRRICMQYHPLMLGFHPLIQYPHIRIRRVSRTHPRIIRDKLLRPNGHSRHQQKQQKYTFQDF